MRYSGKPTGPFGLVDGWPDRKQKEDIDVLSAVIQTSPSNVSVSASYGNNE
ncbi:MULTISPECIES: hypothetical protein [Candidatus Nitrosocaldus]|jgi:hypothetical protein|uniref:Uncharacterized protein n=1 Tax=Candidatus Nitrosocaldus cavascurensis TaxID=2058097 RepID=A0A2K5AQH3_9ARCH|nr:MULTISPECIES: hypothetical protein [Candidatus Nitrosocaldus]SPC33857.1 protein of unknown function [Candidatus Nitrosocaldus cavascurensis]